MLASAPALSLCPLKWSPLTLPGSVLPRSWCLLASDTNDYSQLKPAHDPLASLRGIRRGIPSNGCQPHRNLLFNSSFKIMRLMKDYPLKLLPNYRSLQYNIWAIKERILEFFNWRDNWLEKLAQINSGLKPSGRRTRRIKDEISDQLDILICLNKVGLRKLQ